MSGRNAAVSAWWSLLWLLVIVPVLVVAGAISYLVAVAVGAGS